MKKALFVCIGNAGRSQMAQAFYERLGGEARSAGSHPERELHSTVVEAMDEVGVDLSGRKPKGFTDSDVQWADVVVTMGCGDVCPSFPGKEYVDWNLADPAGMSLEDVRQLRSVIQQNVAEL
jgi:arsenate reductase (thioredoxin)